MGRKIIEIIYLKLFYLKKLTFRLLKEEEVEIRDGSGDVWGDRGRCCFNSIQKDEDTPRYYGVWKEKDFKWTETQTGGHLMFRKIPFSIMK